MEVGVDHDAFPMSCGSCGFVWLCMIQIDIIDWGDGEVEYIYGVSGICPYCEFDNKIQIDV